MPPEFWDSIPPRWDGRSAAEIHGFTLDVIIAPLVGTVLNQQGLMKVGVIDSGASKVVIPRDVARRLALPARNLTNSEIANGHSVQTTVYHGLLKVPALGFEEPLEMLALENDYDTQRVLLGRNFLAEFIVTLDARNNRARFERHPPGHGYYPPGPVEDE